MSVPSTYQFTRLGEYHNHLTRSIENRRMMRPQVIQMIQRLQRDCLFSQVAVQLALLAFNATRLVIACLVLSHSVPGDSMLLQKASRRRGRTPHVDLIPHDTGGSNPPRPRIFEKRSYDLKIVWRESARSQYH